MLKSFFNKILFVLTLFIQSQYSAWSQTDYTIITQDLEAWSSVGLKYKTNNNFTFSFFQGLRLNTNASITDQILSEVGIKYAVNKFLYFGTDFRYIADKNGSEGYDNDFRFNIDGGFKHQYNRFDFKYRLRYQNKNEIGFSKGEGDEIDHVLRFKFSSEYNIKNWKLDPQFSTEIFRTLGGLDAGFDKLRVSFKTDYSLKKIGELSPFYSIEWELNKTYPKTTYIIGLNYTYTLKYKQ